LPNIHFALTVDKFEGDAVAETATFRWVAAITVVAAVPTVLGFGQFVVEILTGKSVSVTNLAWYIGSAGLAAAYALGAGGCAFVIGEWIGGRVGPRTELALSLIGFALGFLLFSIMNAKKFFANLDTDPNPASTRTIGVGIVIVGIVAFRAAVRARGREPADEQPG
jgi:hypothetical protein